MILSLQYTPNYCRGDGKPIEHSKTKESRFFNFNRIVRIANHSHKVSLLNTLVTPPNAFKPQQKLFFQEVADQQL